MQSQLKITKLLKPPDETMAQMRPATKQMNTEEYEVEKHKRHTVNPLTYTLLCSSVGCVLSQAQIPHFDSSFAHVSATATIQTNFI